MASSDAEVIKEYLVSIGVKMDSDAAANIGNILGTIGGAVVKLATILVAGTAATEKFVDKIASKFEDLYWASKRLHSTVSDIQDFTLAIKNLGGDQNSALGSLENMARRLRTNPGYAGLLGNLGINSNQGAVNIAKQLATKLKGSGMPYFRAAQWAQTFGLDEGTFWAEWNAKAGDLDRKPYGEGYKKAGVDADKLAASSQKFEVGLRDIGVKMDLVAARMTSGLIPVLDKLNEKLAAFGGAANNRDNFGVKFDYTKEDVAESSANARNARKAVAGFIAGKAAAGFRWLQGLSIRSAFQGMGWTKEQASGIAANAVAESGGDPRRKGDGGQAYGVFQWHPDRQAAFKKWSGKDIRDSSLDDQFRFAHYELTQGADAGARKAGRLLRAAKTAAEAADIMTRFYERPRHVDRDAAIRSIGASKIVNLNQKTDIHVAAGPAAAATASRVKDQQTRVNGDLLRNLKPAIQ